MNKKTVIILILIVLVASFLRLWQLSKVPISPDWDEVALGYNAYSILNTGRDEYGKSLPVVLRSFDDYKPAMYAYFAIPFVKTFGLNISAVRLPSAVFGILTILATFFLVKELFKRNDLALLSAFLLAISPWHIQFSRVAFESNVGLAFNVFAVLFFLKGLKKPKFLIVSTFFMGINLYIYQSEKVFTPLLLLVLILIFRKDLFSVAKKYIASAVIIGILVILPMAGYTITNRNVFERAKGVSIFSQANQLLQENSIKTLEDKRNHDALGLIFDNRRIIFVKEIISGYLSHFDLNWLFITGDIARHHAPNMGLLYLFELPFLLIGVYRLIFDKFDIKAKILIFSWFLIVPIPASITTGVPHAVRTLNFLPIFQVFTAIGLLYFLNKVLGIRHYVLGIKIKYFMLTVLFIILFFNFGYYMDQYFVQQNYFNAKEWQYGYAKITKEVERIESSYKKIIVSNKPPMDQSYMFFLFYLKYSPSLYQRESRNASGGFAENHKFGKFEFRPIDWSQENKDGDTLYIGTTSDFLKDVPPIYSVNYPDGQPSMEIIK